MSVSFLNSIPANHRCKYPHEQSCSSLQKSKIKCSKRFERRSPRLLISSAIAVPDDEVPSICTKSDKNRIFGEKNELTQVGSRRMAVLCGLGYYANGFRGFPWLALNFHMAHGLNMDPSTLQLVQNLGNLPMVAKPLYGVLSDSLYIGGARRIPYISIGVVLQALSWGTMALIPIATEAQFALMACVLLTNLGASISEVAMDALVAEYGQKKRIPGLQYYAYTASALGGVVANLLGGFFLLRTQQTKSMFLAFAALLALHLTVSLRAKEQSLGLTHTAMSKSVTQAIGKQYADLLLAIKDERISRPLFWAVSSIALIPVLSGSIFCYQTQRLGLDPWIIGMSKVTGQLMVLTFSVLYNRFGRSIPMKKVVFTAQLLYSISLLLDLVLVKQINLQLGITNEAFTLCFSGLSETISQFKLLPFHVLFASLAPPGCEGSLMSFVASALCLSSIFSGFLGVGLASFLGVTSGDYSNLSLGIAAQFCAALLPLFWIDCVPTVGVITPDKAKNRGASRRARRNRRVGRRVVFDSSYSYRRERERESDLRR